MPIANANDFRFHGWPEQLVALRKLYEGDHPLQRAGAHTLRAFDIVQSKIKRQANGEPLPYKPENKADYGDSDIARSMQSVAQLIKMDLGLRVATVDFGGWDTHQGQAYYFNVLMEQLSTALGAFYNDLSRYHSRLNVIVMSEFGRRLKANQSQGTDHGHGNVMMVMGGGVQGGKVYGQWPGLATEQLDSRADLAVTTDFRAVLAEVMSSRFGLGDVGLAVPRAGQARTGSLPNGLRGLRSTAAWRPHRARQKSDDEEGGGNPSLRDRSDDSFCPGSARETGLGFKTYRRRSRQILMRS